MHDKCILFINFFCWKIFKITVTYIYLQTTNRYELLNYSEHGTTVDNVFYSCNYGIYSNDEFSDVSVEGNSIKTKDQKTVEAIRKIAYRNKPAEAYISDKQCVCKCARQRDKLQNRNSLDQGWEGSGMVDHGSIIKFGCHTFVFSVVDEFTSR